MLIRKWVSLLPLLIFACVQVFAQETAPDILFAKGFDLFKNGRFADSAAAFEALAADKAAGNILADVRYMQIVSLLNAGRPAEADILAAQFNRLFPGNSRGAEMTYQQGRIAFAQSHYKEALDYFSRFMADFPDSAMYPDALFWHSETLYQLGRIGPAHDGMRRLLAQFPESDKRAVAEWRLEVMGLEAREGRLKRILDFSREESLQRQRDYEGFEKYYEHALERYNLLIRSLRSTYGLTGFGKAPLYADSENGTPTPILAFPVLPAYSEPPKVAVPAEQPNPQPQPVQPSLSAIELAKINKLNALLSAKNKLLRLLASKLEHYAAEVSK